VQEYEPPKTIAPHKANQRLAGVLAEIPSVLGIDKSQVFLKIRRKQRSIEQYEKQGNKGDYHTITENGCQFLVNFEDYLDTGLFLDHRPMRLLIQQQAKDKNFLNLYAYTGTASVHAARGGAKSSTTIDMSNTHLEWAKNNFNINGMDGNHSIIRANSQEWLSEQAQAAEKMRYELIFLDPPTFSNSKRMENHFDIQIDYIELINDALALLTEDGILYFSTNFKRFKIDTELFADTVIEDISQSTIPHDFSRSPRVHYCWKIQKK
jgi:23S rRNA (guanine2445-N2)-methyltransferase / 23S rRNA (guanine2069-N7)-methyltransferase